MAGITRLPALCVLSVFFFVILACVPKTSLEAQLAQMGMFPSSSTVEHSVQDRMLLRN
jgi:hypothetical protein